MCKYLKLCTYLCASETGKKRECPAISNRYALVCGLHYIGVTGRTRKEVVKGVDFSCGVEAVLSGLSDQILVGVSKWKRKEVRKDDDYGNSGREVDRISVAVRVRLGVFCDLNVSLDLCPVQKVRGCGETRAG